MEEKLTFGTNRHDLLGLPYGEVEYQLYGVVHHSGSLNGGHYTSDVMDENGNWFYCNDSSVSEISSECQKRHLRQSETPYLLFYK